MENLYHTLGVSKEATLDEIKKAYKEKAKQYHPDMEGGDEEKMKALVRAYEVLSDPQKRALYDSTGKIETHSREAMVEEMVSSMFMQAIQAEGANVKYKDLVNKSKNIAQEAMEAQREGIKDANDEIELLKELSSRVTRKNGLPNILKDRLEGAIDRVSQHIAIMEDHLALLSEAHAEFDSYFYRTDSPTEGIRTRSSDSIDSMEALMEMMRRDMKFKFPGEFA